VNERTDAIRFAGECRLGHWVKAILTRSEPRLALDMLSASCLAFQLALPIMPSRPFRWIRSFVKRESKACESQRNLMRSVCLPQRFLMCIPSSVNHIDGRIGIVCPTFSPIPHSVMAPFLRGRRLPTGCALRFASSKNVYSSYSTFFAL
jgi:hypothetical protein